MEGRDESAWLVMRVVRVVQGLEATVARTVWEIAWSMRQRESEGSVVKLTAPPYHSP